MQPDRAGWLGPAFGIAAAVTALRLLLLRFDRTDLYVDEAQYWLWGQSFAFGYYSKPPLIAWVIGGVTRLAGSDAPFWVRAPGPVFHAATGLILGALAARLRGSRVAVWVVASYVTLPMVALGSLLMSTDTIMAPFFAAAVYFHGRLVAARAMRWAVLAGAAAGMAFLAKYAALYFLIGAGLGALLFPGYRIAPRHAAGLLATFGLVILPNILWNVQNGFATLSHTLDNVGWVRADAPGLTLHFGQLAEFFLAQFAVFGPVLFAALVWAVVRPRSAPETPLLVFVVPAIAAVCVQALLDRAYANWAASAYFAGTLVVVAALVARPRLLAGSLAFNAVLSLILPLLSVLPWITLFGDQPLLARYLGRQDLSVAILDLAHSNGDVPIVAERRDVLADLFYTGRSRGLSIYAPAPKGRPLNHYEQTHPLPDDLTGPVLFIGERAPRCGSDPASAHPLDTSGGAYDGIRLNAYLVPAECLHVRR